VVRLIRKYFPDDLHNALAVAKCESGLNPYAYNPSNTNGTQDKGLYQINTVHNATLARHGLDPWKPEHNVKFARMLYDKNGWQDWSCVTQGYIAMR